MSTDITEGELHYLGTTADGRHVYIPVPPGADAEAIKARAPELSQIVVQDATAKPVLDLAQVLAKARRQQLHVQRPSGNLTRTITTDERVGRNAPCPCGSGRKFKRCHWRT